MMKRLLCLTAMAMVGLMPVAALANQIVLGGDGVMTFTSSGGVASPITLASPSVSSLNSGSYEAPTGNTIIALQPWSMTFDAAFSFGGLSGGQFLTITNGGGTAFSWGGNGGGAVTGKIIWTLVTDDTSTPRFNGGLLITGNTVTASNYGGLGAIVLADFVVGNTARIDFIVNLGTNPKLNAVYNHTGATTTSGHFSSGEVALAEPGTLLFLGAGMVGLGYMARRRLADPRG